MADSEQKYSLSFTSIGARRPETVEVARSYADCLDWVEVRRRIVEDNILSLNKESTRKRVGSELIKRLRTLCDSELAFLADAVGDDQLAMTWVAICRAYPVLRAFSTDVVAARYAGMVPDVPRTVWPAFVEDEAADHPELDRLAEKSRKQLETRAFGMLRECRLIDGDYNITPLCPSARFVTLVREAAPQDLDVFPKAGALL